jgi:biopolymer transport protein ExbB/TolQ
VTTVGQLLDNIGHDVRTIASDELEMGRTALVERLEAIVEKIAVALLCVIVGLIGFGMLCVTAVFALSAVIPAIWLRMLLMSIVYIAVGATTAQLAARRIRTNNPGDLQHQVDEAHDTMNAIKKGLAR